MRAALAVLLVTSTASAAHVVVRAESTCPSATQIEASLRATVPELVIGEPAEIVATVVDHGDTFELTIGVDTRHFDDPERACEDRAAKIAVVIALFSSPNPPLESAAVRRPTRVLDSEPVPASSRTSDPVPIHETSVPRRAEIQLAARGVLAVAPDQHASPTGGGGLRLYVGLLHIGAVIGLAGLAPGTLTFGTTKASLWRVPIDVGVRGRLVVHKLALSADAEVVVGPQITRGVDLVHAATQNRLELGLALVARAEYWVTHRVAPFIEVGYEGIPRAYHLTLPGAGTVGHTPQSWLDVSAGLAVKLR